LDNTGRTIKKLQNINGQNHYFNGLKSGVYMIRVADGNIIATQKMIVQ
ncbi:MAG: hypothetical protein RIR96_1474, partial [Bacteroidota bacterium]|jgi:hypothetical protein